MKKFRKLLGIIAIGAVIAASVLALAGCGSKCSKDGSCYVLANGDYEYCGDQNCAVYSGTGVGSISCNCD